MTLSTALCVQLACIWEASARKAGNVHRYRDFEDAGYIDFLASAAAIAPLMESAQGRAVGATILQAVQATRQVVHTNTNLGIILLLAPLASVPRTQDLRTGVESILADLTIADARLAYEAIRLAQPGGLGSAKEQDVHAAPTQTLREVMALARERDLIALQYANGYREVFDDAVPALLRGLERHGSLENAIVACHLELLARHGDSLIARKRCPAEAEEASRRAAQVLAHGWPEHETGQRAFADFDAWLRAAGSGRNPGATADLLAAALFAALRDSTIQVPGRLPWASTA